MNYSDEAQKLLSEIINETKDIDEMAELFKTKVSLIKMINKILRFSYEPGINLFDLRQLLTDLSDEI